MESEKSAGMESLVDAATQQTEHRRRPWPSSWWWSTAAGFGHDRAVPSFSFSPPEEAAEAGATHDGRICNARARPTGSEDLDLCLGRFGK
jgi:hypothetical protein